MKGSLLSIAFLTIVLQLSCLQPALAVTWFDSNTRPDGVSDSNQNIYMAPAEDGSQVVYGSGAGGESEASTDIFDSGD